VRDDELTLRCAVLLAPISLLQASVEGTTELQAQILPPSMFIIPDKLFEPTLSISSEKSQAPIHIEDADIGTLGTGTLLDRIK